MKRCLVIELWGIGDAVLMTALLQGLNADGWTVTVLATSQVRDLLEGTYPWVAWVTFAAPWTAFRGKYRWWSWSWHSILETLRTLRRAGIAVAVSVRSDPRDAFLMRLTGARRRVGFAHPLSNPFLNELVRPRAHTHIVEDWWLLQDQIVGKTSPHFPPKLVPETALPRAFVTQLAQDGKPWIAVHCGARSEVRRWPEHYYRELIVRLRAVFDFRLMLFPDPDGYGSGLGDLAEQALTELTLRELTAALSYASALLCNDSGPAHMAAALDVPVLSFFGPQRPEWFQPFGPRNHVVIRDLCVFRPCSDACRFSEPYCLTRLTPDSTWPEVRDWVASRLPDSRFP